MKRWVVYGLAVAFVGMLSIRTQTAQGEQLVVMKGQAPDFKEVAEWINAQPLQMKDLRGKVVVVHFWAFG